MDSQCEAGTEVDHDVSDGRLPLSEKDTTTKALSRMVEIDSGLTKLLSSFLPAVPGLFPTLEVSENNTDTEVEQDESEEPFSLLLPDHIAEPPSLVEKIRHEVLEMINSSIISLKIIFFAMLFILVLIIISLGSISVNSAATALSDQSTWPRLEQIVSLCELPPGFISQREISDQLGTSLVGKIFYTLMEGDEFTSEEACSIESTLKSNPNTTCYIMFLSTPKSSILKTTTEKKREKYSIIEKYDNAMILNVDGESYFRASPLYNLWKHFRSNSPLIQFAARVLTIWQFGGTTYDSHLLTLGKDSISALPDLMDTVVMDLNRGLVMSAHQQCHAFLLEVVKVLAAVGPGEITETSEREVLSLALVNFCDKVQTTSNNGSVAIELACAGITGLHPELLCYKNQSDPGCTWSYSRQSASESPILAPVTAMWVNGVNKGMDNSSQSRHRRSLSDL